MEGVLIDDSFTLYLQVFVCESGASCLQKGWRKDCCSGVGCSWEEVTMTTTKITIHCLTPLSVRYVTDNAQLGSVVIVFLICIKVYNFPAKTVKLFAKK